MSLNAMAGRHSAGYFLNLMTQILFCAKILHPRYVDIGLKIRKLAIA